MMNIKFNLIATLACLIYFAAPSFSQTIEKLDSTVNTSLQTGTITTKGIHLYDEQARDTFYQLLLNTNGSLDPFTSTRTFFNPNQTIVETYLESISGLTRRDVITLDSNGDEVEREIETYSFATSQFSLTAKEVITTNTAALLEVDVYAWTGTDFLLNLKREIQYSSSGGSISTTSQYSSNGNLTPQQRQTIEIDETTGVQTLLKVEGYNPGLEMWVTSFMEVTTIDVGNFSGVKVNSSTNGGVSDSILISYDTEWLAVEQFNYKFDQNDEAFLNGKDEFDYTANRNILENRIFSNQTGSLVASSTIKYYYSTVVISSIDEISSTPFPVRLLYRNPDAGDGTILVKGDNTTAQRFNFQMINANGQLLFQEKVRTGERVNLNNRALSAGIYFMTLQKENQVKTWKLVIE